MATQQMLCGDEINAAVIDLGSQTCRFGSAGQDSPRHVFRSDVCTIGDERRVGDAIFRTHPANGQAHPLHASESKWEDVELLLTHGLEDCMRVSPRDHALMFARNSVLSSVEDHEQLLQLCFEKLEAPSMFSMPSATLSAFSVGRPTALIVDLGASGTTVSPVVDGYTLRGASLRSKMGGQLLDHLLLHFLTSDGKYQIKPWFEKSGCVVPTSQRMMHVFDVVRDVKQWMCLVPPASIANGGDPIAQLPPPYELPDGTLLNASYTLCTLPEQCFFPSCRLPSTSAFIQHFIEQPLAEMGYLYYGSPGQCSVPSHGGHADQVPTGNNRKRSRSLLDLPSESAASTTQCGSSSSSSSTSNSNSNSNNNNGANGAVNNTSGGSSSGVVLEHEALSDLVYCSLARADADYRRELANNIVLVGGNALLDGLSQRLNRELAEVVPSHIKFKLTSNLSIEKQNSSWLGGSILSICGSFHQLWVGRQEYEEQGAARLARSRFLH